jgi:hypothetical protein
MQHVKCIVTVMLILAVAPHAFAQAPQPNRDEAVRKMLNLALDNIQRALCEDRKPCAPATPAERANPPLTIDEARLVVDRGVLSAAGEHCGLDWQKLNFLPLMSYWRNSKQSSERKMALITLLHGIMQGVAKPKAQAVGPCTDAMRRNLEARLAFRA